MTKGAVMKVLVIRADGNGVDTHEADWVDGTVGVGGVLRINAYDGHDEVVYWEVYADGAWASFKLAEPPTPETVRRRTIAEQNASRGNGGTFARR